MKLKELIETSPAERLVRSENRGDARTTARIKEIRAKEKNGLISAGEAERAINRMSKSYKKMKKGK